MIITNLKKAMLRITDAASQLIDSGMDVLTISRRLGHASPSITLDVYGHRFARKDDRAAAVFDAAFSSVLSE